MKLQIGILICLMIVFLGSGCTKKNYSTPPGVVEVNKYIYVTAPLEPCHTQEDLVEPKFEKLEKGQGKHIANKKNMSIMADNFDKLKEKYDKMRTSILCYDEKVKASHKNGE